MDVSLREMRAFLAVCAHLNVSAAAAELRTAQSNLSRILAGLEQTLGHRLFIRSTRNLRLTAEGELFRETAQRVVNLYDFELDTFAERLKGAVGAVRLAAVPSVSSLLLPKLLRVLDMSSPEVELSFVEGDSAEVHRLISANSADIGIASEVTLTESLQHEPYLTDSFVALVATAHHLAQRAEVTWAELADNAYVTLPQGTSVHALTAGALLQAGVAPRAEVPAPNIGLAARIVAENLGVTAVPSLALGLFDVTDVVRIPLRSPTVARSVSFFWRRGDDLSAAVHSGLQALRQLPQEGIDLPPGASWETMK